jgi:hypothetical protein
MPAYFHDKLAEAAGMPPARGRTTPLLRLVGRGTPVVGSVIWNSADVYYRQQLAPSFLAQWERDGAEAQVEPNRTPRK